MEYEYTIDYTDEEWRRLPEELSDYDVSNYGRVRRHDTDKLIQCLKTRAGYVITYLKTINGTASYTLHLLVALAFLPERPYPSAHIIHLNGSLIDNRPSNLQWTERKTPLVDKTDIWKKRLCESCKFSRVYFKHKKKVTKRYCTIWRQSGKVRLTTTTRACKLYKFEEVEDNFLFNKA